MKRSIKPDDLKSQFKDKHLIKYSIYYQDLQ